jgi:hypothetical protein
LIQRQDMIDVQQRQINLLRVDERTIYCTCRSCNEWLLFSDCYLGRWFWLSDVSVPAK